MTTYKENDTVIYTDNEGNRYDTFVIFNTDRQTGLTHINHHNLKVAATYLELHPRSANGCTMPMDDSFSFELFKQLKEKFINQDRIKHAKQIAAQRDMRVIKLLARAS
ncbi:MAG: hypothetical protein ACXVAY_07380 [Mucilaginibacter sp.]